MATNLQSGVYRRACMCPGLPDTTSPLDAETQTDQQFCEPDIYKHTCMLTARLIAQREEKR
ncbi:hypothetical protein Hanom_Chr11g01047531 [Helianthus anomalus]